MEKFSHAILGSEQQKKRRTEERTSDTVANHPESSMLPKTDTYGDAPKKWQEFYTTFQRIRKEVLNKLITSDKLDDYYDKMQEQLELFASSVDDPHAYLAYHICIASGTGPIRSPKTDFEGDYALLPYYQKLLTDIEK